jgi:hypothetical protein
MATPLISEILPDFLEEIVYLLGQMGEGALGQQMRALRIESLCDCGDEQCASFATAAEVKVDRTVELQAMDVKYLLDDYNERKG